MMKRALFILLASTIGAAIGIVAAILLTTFIPNCGEDCSSDVLVTGALCIFGALGVFCATSLYITRHVIPSPRQSILQFSMLSALFLVPAIGHYVYTLHTEYLRLVAIAPPHPTTDFYHMAITTRKVQGVTNAAYEPIKPVRTIPQWERCLIGTVRCEPPRQVEMLCKTGVIHINEREWPIFALIPEENSPGVPPLESMRLCGN